MFPMARAGATFQVSSMRGKFQGTMAPMTRVGKSGQISDYDVVYVLNVQGRVVITP